MVQNEKGYDEVFIDQIKMLSDSNWFPLLLPLTTICYRLH